MLEKEFKYYIENQNRLLEKYNGKYLVIVGNEIVGNYNTANEALLNSDLKYKAGTYLIQHCTPGTNAYTIRSFSHISY